MASLDWKMMAIKRELSSPFFFFRISRAIEIFIFLPNPKRKQNEKKRITNWEVLDVGPNDLNESEIVSRKEQL